jgi:hypothetical protein
MDPRQQRSRSQMSMGHRQEQDGDYEDEDEFYDDEIAHQLGGLSLQELQQREMAHRRAAGGELPVGGMPAQRNFTFNSDRMNNIGRENQVLLQKLQRIAVKGSGQTGSSGYRPLPSSQAVNRMRKEKEIARQNMQIANRLMNAKSATFDKKKMQVDRANQEKYLKNSSQYPVQQTSAPKMKVKPAAPGRPPWFKELPSIKQARPQGRPEWQD